MGFSFGSQVDVILTLAMLHTFISVNPFHALRQHYLVTSGDRPLDKGGKLLRPWNAVKVSLGPAQSLHGSLNHDRGFNGP